MIEKDGKMYIFCKAHGEQKWLGHIMCLICGRLYQTKNKTKDGFVKDECDCGNRLLPKNLNDDDDYFFGRSICPKCYDENKPQISPAMKIVGDSSLIPEHVKSAYASLICGMFNNFALIPCLVNGEKASAIISYTEEDGDVFMTPHFVAINDKMLVTDLEGNSPGDDPDDKLVH